MKFNWITLLTGLICYLLGILNRASGKYIADKCTDRRKERETRKKKKQQFLNVKQEMPGLIAEFKSDLSKEDLKLIREFVVFPSKKVPGHNMLQYGKPHFTYYEEDHKNLRTEIDLLESHGFIEKIAAKNVPSYKMREEFVALIKKHK